MIVSCSKLYLLYMFPVSTWFKSISSHNDVIIKTKRHIITLQKYTEKNMYSMKLEIWSFNLKALRSSCPYSSFFWPPSALFTPHLRLHNLFTANYLFIISPVAAAAGKGSGLTGCTVSSGKHTHLEICSLFSPEAAFSGFIVNCWW